MRKVVSENAYERRSMISEESANNSKQRAQRAASNIMIEDPLLGSGSIDSHRGIRQHRVSSSASKPAVNQSSRKSRKRNRSNLDEEFEEEVSGINNNNNMQQDSNDNKEEIPIVEDNDYELPEANLSEANLSEDNIIVPDPTGHSQFNYKLGEAPPHLNLVHVNVTDITNEFKNNNNNNQLLSERTRNTDKHENSDDEVPVPEYDRGDTNRNRKLTFDPHSKRRAISQKRRAIGRKKNEKDQYERRINDMDYIFVGSSMKTALTLIAVKGRVGCQMSSYVSIYLCLFVCIFCVNNYVLCVIYKYIHTQNVRI